MLTLDEGAQRAVDCAGVRAEERVLILYDDLANAAPAWALRRAATSNGANAHVRFVGHPDPASRCSVPDGLDDLDVVDELLDLDVVVAFTRPGVLGEETAHRIVAGGGRILTVTGASEHTLTRGAVEADFTAIAPMCGFLAARLTEASQAEVSTPRGTSLTMSLGDRLGVANPPARPLAGVYRFPYAGAIIAPVETSIYGTVVVDVGTTLGSVDPPLTIVIEAGHAVAVSGGSAAAQIEQWLAASPDSSVDTLGVLGFGLNPAVGGSSNQQVSLAGNGHFSLGANRGVGGANHGGRCLEFTFARPSLVLNGVPVLTDGVLQTPLTVR